MVKQKWLQLRYVITILVVGAGLALGALAPAQAATSQSSSSSQSQANGFIISPVRTEITVNKGQSQTIQLSVQNPTNATVTVKAVVNDFVASNDESGDPRLILNNNSPLPANNFKSLVGSIPNITLGPQQKQYFNVTLSVPADAASGGYYGAVRFLPASSNQTGNVGLTASAGSIFLITVPGNLTEKLNLVQLSAADKNGNAESLITSGSVSVLTRLDNVGNIHVQPFGNVIIKNIFGKTVAQYQFNNTNPRANILPDSIRKFVDQLPSTIHWFGRYTIEENIAYQQGSGNLITASATFYYFPLWFLLAVLVVVILIIVWIYWIVHRRRSTSHRRR